MLGAGAALLAAAVPSSVLAVSLLADGGTFADRGSFTTFTPASADPRLAQLAAQRSSGETQMMRFTPAGVSSNAADRSVTVAVRIDRQAAQAVSRRSIANNGREVVSDSGPLRITSTRYNLGLARGYGSFAQAPATSVAPALSASLSSAAIPDLADFRPTPAAQGKPSRFDARIALDEGRSVAAVTSSGAQDQRLDVAGSYRVAPNLNVTAGIRYEQDRDLTPLPEVDQQDSQAVYVGTQFRF